MNHTLNLPGFEGRQVTLKTARLFRGPRLLVDGKPPAQGSQRGELLLQRNDGLQVTARIRNKLFDPLPDLVIDGQTIRLGAPLSGYQWLCAGLPAVLIFFGGMLGGALAGIAILINAYILRLDLPSAVKYIATVMLSLATVLIYLVAARLIHLLWLS